MDKKLQQLKAKWAKKLKKSGFNDIETHDGQYLKYWDSQYFKQGRKPSGAKNLMKAKSEDLLPLDSMHFVDKREYYYAAGHFNTSYPFESKKDSKYWSLHAEGLSNREIAKKCKCSKDIVNKVIKRLKEIMLTWKS